MLSLLTQTTEKNQELELLQELENTHNYNEKRLACLENFAKKVGKQISLVERFRNKAYQTYQSSFSPDGVSGSNSKLERILDQKIEFETFFNYVSTIYHQKFRSSKKGNDSNFSVEYHVNKKN